MERPLGLAAGNPCYCICSPKPMTTGPGALSRTEANSVRLSLLLRLFFSPSGNFTTQAPQQVCTPHHSERLYQKGLTLLVQSRVPCVQCLFPVASAKKELKGSVPLGNKRGVSPFIP